MIPRSWSAWPGASPPRPNGSGASSATPPPPPRRAETPEGEDDPEVVERLARRVAAEAERLGRIIDDLLDLSRIEANESPRGELGPLPVIGGQAGELWRP